MVMSKNQKSTQTGMMNQNLFRSKLLTEAELRVYVNDFLSQFPQEYQDILQIKEELHLVDNRVFRNAENRYLDSSFKSTDGSTVIIEFKKGKLTKELIDECGFVRGYFDLCYQQVPGFSQFVFVSEVVDDGAIEYIEKLNKMVPQGTIIKSLSYADYLKRMFITYAQWSKTNENGLAFMSTCLKCQASLPKNWISDSWFVKIVKGSL